jgi:hypothetical protein
MNVKEIERCVENYLNNEDISLSVSSGTGSSSDAFKYNTAKRVVIAYDKFRSGKASRDSFLITLRNYLLVFQNEIAILDGELLQNNEYGIIKNAAGNYYAVADLPDYVDSDFVEQAFQRRGTISTETNYDGIFLGTNAFIYRLTGYNSFKSLEQKIAVFGALNTPDGYTSLVSLPTGGGKSLITQTMAYQNDGLTIVIVPTVSLAIDQVRNAKNNIKHDTENEIFCYYSGIENERKIALRNAIKQEQAKLLFISPEALIKNHDFSKMIAEANQNKYLRTLVIDEAHIVVEWGDFFRVDYQCLEAWRKELLKVNGQIRTILLSATYTKGAVTTLKQMFVDDAKWIEIRCDALRHEPRFILVNATGYTDKKRKMVELIKKLPHPMVVYVNSPAEAEGIRSTLKGAGIDNLATFTGNTRSTERERIIADWTADKIDLIIATSAFGVGVDKGDVRTVLHLYIPDTPNQYYQELGRGGRDGLTSLSVMCINSKEDIDSAYKRMNKVLSTEKIWGRWRSMYKSQSSKWTKGTVVLDTAVKPVYNITADDEDASVIDIQWNVYVVLLFRRYNLITVRSMVYENKNDSYKIHVEINNDDLRQETDNAPAVISSIRDKEAKGFEREIKRIIRGIEHHDNLCWSEMFFDTYNMVSAYCGGCGEHHNPEAMEAGKFPLLLPVSSPIKVVSSELKSMCQGAKEVLVIGEEDNYSVINRFLNAGVSTVVLSDNDINSVFDLILNMSHRSDIMLIGIKEYRELSSMSSQYFLSGGILAVYGNDEKNTYTFCNVLRKHLPDNGLMIHYAKDDYYIQKHNKPISAMIDGPKIDSYILERM